MPPHALEDTLTNTKFVRLNGPAMRARVAAFGALTDWEAFGASWNQLGPDTHG